MFTSYMVVYGIIYKLRFITFYMIQRLCMMLAYLTYDSCIVIQPSYAIHKGPTTLSQKIGCQGMASG